MPRITKISAETFNSTPIETNVRMGKDQYILCERVNYEKYFKTRNDPFSTRKLILR